jgi:PPOX class probable F420-dependent enzyme
MPDYGTATDAEGMLAWSWAAERLTSSHDYWVATTMPDGRPHVTPVWGAWVDGTLWFSCGPTSRKARNLTRDPRCSVATDRPSEPVVVDGTASRVTGREPAARFAELSTAKYGVEYSVDFFEQNALFSVAPTSVFALDEADFGGSPTKWTFS